MGQHRMPQISGVEEPNLQYPSENIFRLNKDEWTVQPVENPIGRN